MLLVWVCTVVKMYEITHLRSVHFMVCNYTPQFRMSNWVFWRWLLCRVFTYWMSVSSWNSNVETLSPPCSVIRKGGPLGDDYIRWGDGMGLWRVGWVPYEEWEACLASLLSTLGDPTGGWPSASQEGSSHRNSWWHPNLRLRPALWDLRNKGLLFKAS